MEREVGEVFECDGKKLQVIEDPFEVCQNCYFDENECSKRKNVRGECLIDKREDGQNVIFKELGNSEEKEEKTILDEAKAIVEGSRQSDYGDAANNFDRIAAIVNSVYPVLNITSQQCCMVMIAVKLIREGFKHKRDNLVDLCGYTEILNEINKKGE